MLVTHAYRFALDPTPRQIGVLLAHAGAARVAHNWCLGQVKANLDQREAERSYGLAEDDLTPVFPWSLYGMRKKWNQAALVERQVAGSGPETRNGRGADHKSGLGPAGGCEASTSHRTSRGSGQARTFVQ